MYVIVCDCMRVYVGVYHSWQNRSVRSKETKKTNKTVPSKETKKRKKRSVFFIGVFLAPPKFSPGKWKSLNIGEVEAEFLLNI